MSNIGVYIELKDKKFKKANLETIGFAQRSGLNVFGIIFSNEIGEYKDKLKGIKTLIQVKGDDLTFQPDYYVDTISQIVKDFDLNCFIGSYSAQCRELFPRISARLEDTALINDCIEVNLEDNSAVKPVYSGKLLSKYIISSSRIKSFFNLYSFRYQ